MQLTIIIVFACSGLYWLFQLYSLVRTTLVMPRLEDFNYNDLERFPLMSVIITACNEAESIEKAVKSRLKDDYPELEILLIDDRSTDATPEIVDKLAAADPRVRAIHITELPEGWLGKVNALHRGVQEANGEWFLFSDADVFVKPGTLKQLMAWCETKRIDHAAVIPGFHSGGFFVDAAVSVFLRVLIAVGRAYKFEDKKSNTAGGAGAFNLVKRSAFEKTKGFPWLKLEIIDDVTLAQMLKTSGAATSAVGGKGFVEVCWYGTFKGMIDGAGRAGAAALGNYNSFRHTAFACLGFIIDMVPFLVLFTTGIPFLRYLGLFVIAAAVSASVLSNRLLGLPLLPGILLPVGHIIVLFANLWGAVKFVKNKGIIWRGTFYPKKKLKQGRRFRYILRGPK
ncbi:MAG: glycosyltransferase [bacterium]|nr:glycosyltransferase [bacterium]